MPSWADPSVKGDNGTGNSPPAPAVESHPDVGESVSGVLLALFGLVTYLFGGFLTGGAAITGGIDLIITGASQINWAKLRCDLYWYRYYFYHARLVLHNIQVLGALDYPYAAELALDQTTISFLGMPTTFDSGEKVVKSRTLLEGFPTKPWQTLTSDIPPQLDQFQLGKWVTYPQQRSTASGFENPQTAAYLTGAYPTFFIDDDINNPLSNGDVKTGGTWPPGFRQKPMSKVPVQFGNAVANAVDLFQHLGVNLPDWNLDADRGLSSLTWAFTNNLYTDPVEIQPEP